MINSNGNEDKSEEEIKINTRTPVKARRISVNGNPILMFKNETKMKKKKVKKNGRSKTLGQKIKWFFGKIGCSPCKSRNVSAYKDSVKEMVIGPKRERKKKIDNKHKKNLVIDLDGTLVKVDMLNYSAENKKIIMSKYDYAIGVTNNQFKFFMQIRLKGKKYVIGVKKRPFLEEFLDCVSDNFNIILWSEMKKEAVQKITKLIDKEGYISKKFYKGNCVKSKFGLSKPLSRIPGCEPSQTILIDDNFLNIVEQDKNNSLVIGSYMGNSDDRELIHYQKFLKYISKKQNIRPVKYWKYRFDLKRNSENKKSVDASRNFWKMSLSQKPSSFKYKQNSSMNESSVGENHAHDVPNKSCNYSLSPSFLNEIVSNNVRSELNKRYGKKKRKKRKRTLASGPFLHPESSYFKKRENPVKVYEEDKFDDYEKIPKSMIRDSPDPVEKEQKNIKDQIFSRSGSKMSSFGSHNDMDRLINNKNKNGFAMSPQTKKKKRKEFFNFRINKCKKEKKTQQPGKNKKGQSQGEMGESSIQGAIESKISIENSQRGYIERQKSSTKTIEIEEAYNLAMLEYTGSTSDREREANALYRDEKLNAKIKDYNFSQLKNHQLVFKSKFKKKNNHSS